MHSKGVYHRDLKLENILLSEALDLKIGDFGLSINIEEMKGSPTTTTLVGSIAYFPPEIFDFLPFVPSSFDIFTAGYILFALFTGKAPFG